MVTVCEEYSEDLDIVHVSFSSLFSEVLVFKITRVFRCLKTGKHLNDQRQMGN